MLYAMRRRACQVRMQPAVQLDARLHDSCPTHHHEAQRHLDAVAADQALPPVLHVPITSK